MLLRTFSLLAIMFGVLAGPVHAQTFRFLNYDMAQTVEMQGTVQSLDWMNPNSELHVLVADAATGKPVEWTFVMGPPLRAEKFGWNKDSVKRGDRITLLMHPARNNANDSNAHSGQLVKVTLPDGRMLQATEPDPAG